MNQLSPLRRTVGLVLIMIGGFWAAISLGFLEESFMTGQPIYTVLGALVAIAGVLVLVVKGNRESPDRRGDGSHPE